MKRLSNEEITQIRQKANIVDVISSYIPLQQAGSNYKAICPFHDDHNPSMSINTSKQIYKCFVCGQGGNVFGFVKDYEQISFIEAVKKVGESVGFDFSDYDVVSSSSKVDESKSRQFQIMNEAQRYLEYSLSNTKDESVQLFLENRGLTSEIQEAFKIGYADPQYPLGQYLLKKGFRIEELETLQLAQSDREFFTHRIMFPITDHQNQIVAYTARALGDNSPKYINSATTPIYVKSDILYNYPMTKDPLLKSESCVICEGVMDVIAFYKAGKKKVIATLGTTLSDQQIKSIKRLNCPIVLAFDGDDAGLSATYKLGQQLLENQIEVSVINNKTTLDPDEILKQHNKEALLEMINDSMHWIEFVMDFANKRFGLTSYNAKKRVAEMVGQQLSYVDSVDQQYFSQQLSELTGLSSDIIDGYKINHKPKEIRVNPINKPKQSDHIHTFEKDVLVHLLEAKKYAHEFKLKLGYLLDENANDLALLITNLYNTRDTISVADCLDLNLNPTQQALLLEISEDPLYQYEKSSHKLSEAMSLVALADIEALLLRNQNQLLTAQDSETKLKLLQEKIDLNQQKDRIKNGGFDEKI